MGNNKIITSLIWKFLERFGTVGVQFLIQIFLARLLSPSDYGTIALITVFITVSSVFVQNGFNTSLIQRRDINDNDYSSVFWISIVVAMICYLILFVFAPIIANFYQINELVLIIRVLGITLFFGSYNSIQIAKISREFQFKKLFFSSLISISVSGFVGILLAYLGFGIWTLVVQQLLNQIIISIVLYFVVDLKIKMILEMDRIKSLFNFGSKLLASSLIDVIYNNLYNLIIGKYFSSSLLGFYNRADQFPNLIVNNVNGAIQSVILPAMAEKQDDVIRIKEMVRRAMSLSSYVVFPLMIGMAACAKPMVVFLLTDKWLPCVPFIQLLCFSYMLWPIHTANLQAINALGHSDIYLKLEIVKKIVGIISLIVSVPFGVNLMVIMKIITGILSSFINAFPNKKLLNYGFFNQITDLLPSLINSLIMGISILFVSYILSLFSINVFCQLIIEVSIGIVIYIVMSLIFKNKNFRYLHSFLKNKNL